ncbi:transposase [Olivibacter sp. SDN3]|jgi:transposase|uniref:transposase n=1 Tax=Olivibacter sp. SDN3 TaxID=2764720 RepID=UPI0016516983|nr:transposase [Olivibacter sp. SDN3]QNL48479.1 transposase [Olivibacter sp. SDN3]QNL48727.1 transposase [Olivibacter sp. SDN3]QNL48731.1 transposase [Olivibacter sp. SDN3]QNL48771.1 transposase [Olivibacter sp. SDN3]QNL48788.1 transposase [Olivibacter sp. SDN3]
MHRKFDDSFKIMAVDLSVVKGSVADVAKELDIDPSLLSKWRRNPRYNGNKVLPDNPKISPEEQELRILRKKLRDTELERDILKKAIAIFSRGDGPYTGS